MGRQFAISDIHGCAETFRKLVVEILRFSPQDTLYLLGDYVNKGPNSKGVLDFIISLNESGHNVIALKGNHESYLLQSLQDPLEETNFLARGGVETLESFGVHRVQDIPASYLILIENMPLFFFLEKYILVHAGFDFESKDPFKDEYSMLNIRKMTVDLLKTGGRKVLHGHIPTTIEDIQHVLESNYSHVSIDGGCVYTHIHSLRHLAALDLDTGELFIQKNIEKPWKE